MNLHNIPKGTNSSNYFRDLTIKGDLNLEEEQRDKRSTDDSIKASKINKKRNILSFIGEFIAANLVSILIIGTVVGIIFYTIVIK